MLQKVALDGIKLPRLYIAENMDDVKKAKERGIPYIRWNGGMDKLIRQMLRPTLEKMFPKIKWDNVLGKRESFRTKIYKVKGHKADDVRELIDRSYDNEEAIRKQFDYMSNNMKDGKSDIGNSHSSASLREEEADIAESKREFVNDNYRDEDFWDCCDIETYVGDLSSCVNIEVLQGLNLLPKFIGDIVDCIKINLSNNMRWKEGYNKKRGVPIGTFGCGGTLPNLIILDVSGSIPRGISATMLTLIDTMRTELDADLIITSDRSVYYPHGADLPDPQTLRRYFGIGNEAVQFYSILENKIAGRSWGHVISFGDYDSPASYDNRDPKAQTLPNMENTSVKAVHHYHTRPRSMYRDSSNTKTGRTGYAEWVHVVNPKVEEHYNSSWCNVIEED